jgi:2-keto-4-pentenoate hydratase/2-oxohepta-3-ene-1,7-dioic acid hydratase in catechol pathway
MKLAYFNDYRLGVVKAGRVVDVTSVAADIPHGEREDIMNRLIEGFARYRGKLEEAASRSDGVPLTAVTLRPPLPRPSSIFCMAVNYLDGIVPPREIDAFQKAPSTIIGPGETMVLPDIPASIFEGEAELAVVIGKRTENVGEGEAMQHVFGYTNFIDGSARDLPARLNPFFQMKSRKTFAPIGPYVVTADEVADPQDLTVKLWVNGVLKQDYSTRDMNHKIVRCISWLSNMQPLLPGDIIACGTHHAGLSAFMDGDSIEIEIAPLGRLTIGVRDELKRTWSRETRADRKGMTPPMTPQLTGKYADQAK